MGKRFQVWDFWQTLDTAVWIGLFVPAMLAAIILDGSTGAVVAGVTSCVGGLSFLVARFELRWRFSSSIRSYTWQGVGIAVRDSMMQSLPLSMSELHAAIEKDIDLAVEFFGKHYPNATADMRKGHEGRFIEVLPGRPKRGSPVAGFIEGHAITNGYFTGVGWMHELDWPHVRRILLHEYGHWCLDAAGEPRGRRWGDKHHEIMGTLGWPSKEAL